MKEKTFNPLFENGFTFEKQPGHIETYFEEVKRAEGFEPRFMFYKKVNQLQTVERITLPSD